MDSAASKNIHALICESLCRFNYTTDNLFSFHIWLFKLVWKRAMPSVLHSAKEVRDVDDVFRVEPVKQLSVISLVIVYYLHNDFFFIVLGDAA